eukprot:TRINITY_DN12459_c0_g1_i1.p1 TRINITY_DN12459_c0_g1~~TRINITY_DN12459_c0_g1_i1.p1  ORF type:complete len:373 (-),score=78.20 TRINITY_DN12459_c0_g1_i1:485-1486(-)
MTTSTMKFSLTKDQSNDTAPFVLKDHWAGELPEAAKEILDIWEYPEVYAEFQADLPRGMLLYGPPGTGKTHFARVLAKMVNCSFLYAAASQFDEIYVGKGAQRVRNLFAEAQSLCEYSMVEKLNARLQQVELPQKKAIIFIDELDSIGTRHSRTGVNSTGHATISQLLTLMDGLLSNNNIFVIGATNHLNEIDPALRRSGRFDRVVLMPLPDLKSRIDIITFYLKSKPGFQSLSDSGLINRYGVLTRGFTAADIKTFAKEAAVKSLKEKVIQRREERQRSNANLPGGETPVSEVDSVVTNLHLKGAFDTMCIKITKERKDFKPMTEAMLQDVD